jgi:hypothetical protein
LVAAVAIKDLLYVESADKKDSDLVELANIEDDFYRQWRLELDEVYHAA